MLFKMGKGDLGLWHTNNYKDRAKPPSCSGRPDKQRTTNAGQPGLQSHDQDPDFTPDTEVALGEGVRNMGALHDHTQSQEILTG